MLLGWFLRFCLDVVAAVFFAGSDSELGTRVGSRRGIPPQSSTLLRETSVEYFQIKDDKGLDDRRTQMVFSVVNVFFGSQNHHPARCRPQFSLGRRQDPARIVNSSPSAVETSREQTEQSFCDKEGRQRKSPAHFLFSSELLC